MAQHNKQRRQDQRENNFEDHIQPYSKTPIHTLSPHCLQLQYANLCAEKKQMKRDCQLLREWLTALSHSNMEVIMEDQDPNGFDLLQKISEFISNDENAYEIILTAVMENMCTASNSEDLDLDKHQQCTEFASVLLEQMHANSMKILEKNNGVRFSPRMLRLALSVYTRSKVG